MEDIMDNQIYGQPMPYKHEFVPRTIGTVAGAGVGAGLGFLAKKLLAKKFPLVAGAAPAMEQMYNTGLNSLPILAGVAGGAAGNLMGEEISDNQRYRQLYNALNQQGQY
jgi:hypothetical protein